MRTTKHPPGAAAATALHNAGQSERAPGDLAIAVCWHELGDSDLLCECVVQWDGEAWTPDLATLKTEVVDGPDLPASTIYARRDEIVDHLLDHIEVE